MVNTHAGMLSTNPTISQYKKMYLPNPYRNITRAHCMQGRHQIRFCKNKNNPRIKTPVNPKQVRVLLCHTGYYREFIRHYSDMTYPLEELLREDQEFDWTNEYNISFDTLKKKLVEAPILKFLNWSIKFHVHIDASGLAIGTVLTQPWEDGMDYPIVYRSRKLNNA